MEVVQRGKSEEEQRLRETLVTAIMKNDCHIAERAIRAQTSTTVLASVEFLVDRLRSAHLQSVLRNRMDELSAPRGNPECGRVRFPKMTE